MIVLVLGFCYHVIHIYIYLFVHHVMKQCHHCFLIRCPGILQPKRHVLVAKGSLHSQECGIFHIFYSYFDLVIARKSVHKGEQRVLGHIVYQGIDMG